MEKKGGEAWVEGWRVGGQVAGEAAVHGTLAPGSPND